MANHRNLTVSKFIAVQNHSQHTNTNPKERIPWLSGATGQAGPYWDQNLTGMHLA